MPDTTIYTPHNWADNFAYLVEWWYSDRKPPDRWPVTPWGDDQQEVEVADYLDGVGAADHLPRLYRELVEELTGEPNVGTYGTAAEALLRLL